MITIYDELRAGLGAGSELEATFGVPATLTRTTPGVFNKVTGKTTGSSTIVQNIKAARKKIEVKSLDGLKSRQTAFVLWIEAQAGDVINFAGQSYRVSAVEENNPDGIGITWLALVGSGS